VALCQCHWQCLAVAFVSTARTKYATADTSISSPASLLTFHKGADGARGGEGNPTGLTEGKTSQRIGNKENERKLPPFRPPDYASDEQTEQPAHLSSFGPPLRVRNLLPANLIRGRYDQARGG
jgi:hypothetical protein